MSLTHPDSEPLPPHVKGSDTSLAAAKSIRGTSRAIRAKVFQYIESRKEEGATDNEIENALNLRHQTASARRRELVQRGVIYDTGDRRTTDSGRKAVIWRVSDPKDRELLAARQVAGSLRKTISARVSKLGPTQCGKLLEFLDTLEPEPEGDALPMVPTSKEDSNAELLSFLGF